MSIHDITTIICLHVHDLLIINLLEVSIMVFNQNIPHA